MAFIAKQIPPSGNKELRKNLLWVSGAIFLVVHSTCYYTYFKNAKEAI